jgi:hypothetical protein
MCKNGIHLADDPLKWYKPGAQYYEAEFEGEILWDEDKSKCCVRKARLIREVPPNRICKELDVFILEDIKRVRWFKPDGKPRKEWKIFYGDSWDAARNAAWDAARNAAWDAAWYAARDAAGNAAWYAAGNAAWDAARNAAEDAAGNAAGNAAWDAARKIFFILVSDLSFKDKKKHQNFVNREWEVWTKGYGLLCDVNGVLYVYALKKYAPE